MRVLVTGGLGFLGASVSVRMCALGHEVTAADNGWFNGQTLSARDREEVSRRRARLADVGVAVVDANLLDGVQTRALLDATQPECVIHMAGMSRVNLAAGDGALEPNVVLTQRLLTALEGVGARRVVYASSSMVYGPFEGERAAETHPCCPTEPYGASKLACEVLVGAWGRARGVETVVLRPTAVYGPGDFNHRVPGRFLDAALADEVMLLHDEGRERLDFTWIDDLAEGAALAATNPAAAGETFNLSRGEARSVADLAEVVRAYIPNARFERVPDSSGRPRRGTLVNDKARRLLGFAPTVDLEEGVRRLLAARGAPVPARPVKRVSPPPPVAFSRPSITERELEAVSAVLRSGWLTHGPENQRFERELAHLVGAPHALAVNSCASALILALRAAGITGEVILPAFTFAATANAVELAGARPVFVDVDPRTLGMDPAAARAAVTPRTEAILAVHLAGMPCAIGALSALASKRGLALFEDAAQALGARVGERSVGTFGRAGCFSFFPTKNLTTGEGGMLISGDAALIGRAQTLAGHGIARGTALREGAPRPWERRQIEVGWNFRMSALQASLGRAQLARIGALNGAREHIAARYDAGLRGSGLALFERPEGETWVHAHYVARVSEGTDRDAFVMALRERGVEASVHYDRPVPYEAPWVARGHGGAGRYPESERLARSILSLPMHPGMPPEEVTRVIETVCAVLG